MRQIYHFEPINTWAASIYSDQSIIRVMNVTNTGYPAYDCQFSVQTPLSDFFSSSSFDIGTNEVKNISLQIISPFTESVYRNSHIDLR